MPKTPILTRTLLMKRLRDGSFRLLDQNLVNTTLGAMLEPRTLVRETGNLQNEDVQDSAFTDFLFVDDKDIACVPGLNSELWPRTFNTQ